MKNLQERLAGAPANADQHLREWAVSINQQQKNPAHGGAR
jgi:hypothetical protein